MNKSFQKIRKYAGLISFIVSIAFLLTLMLPALKSTFNIKETGEVRINYITYFTYIFGGSVMQYDFNIWGLITYLCIIIGGIISLYNSSNHLFWGSLFFLASTIFFLFAKTIFLSFHELTYIADLYSIQSGFYITTFLSFILTIFNIVMSFYPNKSKKNKH